MAFRRFYKLFGLALFSLGILWLLTISVSAQSDIQSVRIEPFEEDVSFSTVELYGSGWVTMPSVELRGRLEIAIQNTDSSDEVYISKVSGSTAGRYWTIYPRGYIKFKATRGDKEGSGIHFYASANTADCSTVVQIVEAK